jgi:ribonucleotide reductase alpha subunit
VALTEKETHGEHVEEEKTLKQKLELIENEKRRKAEWLLAEAAQQQEKQQEYKAFYNDRVEQDELYAAIEQSYLQKRQLSKDEKERLSENEESLLLRREAALKEVEPEPGENVIEIKFRMPITGEPRSRRFLLSDRVEKCFLFVDCFCREEFEEKFSDFDIMQTHPTLILSSLTEKTLGEVFEDSRRENVIVKERLP